MKALVQRTMFITLALYVMGTANNSLAISPALPENGIHLTDWRNIKLKVLISLTAEEFYRLTGKKMTLKEKIGFTLLKGKIKKELKKNPDMTSREFMDSIRTIDKIGWILLGLAVIALIGLIILVNQLPH